MEIKEIKELRDAVQKELKPKRFEHTLGVAYTAANLAMVHDENIEKAWIAGILHDCAKCISYEEQYAICKKDGIELTEGEKRDQSPILHAKAGAVLAKKKYGIKDKEIIRAIAHHSIGRAGMSKLEAIVFIADYIEPGRNQAPDLPLIRKMAYHDLDEAICKIMGDTLHFLEDNEAPIDETARQAYEYYRKLSEKN